MSERSQRRESRKERRMDQTKEVIEKLIALLEWSKGAELESPLQRALLVELIGLAGMSVTGGEYVREQMVPVVDVLYATAVRAKREENSILYTTARKN